jgi:PAS domain S-box-containing protein
MRLLSEFEIKIINVEDLEVIIKEGQEDLADLILLDLSEKEEEGLAMLEKAKLNPEKIPVIVIGETEDKNFGIECMKKGVQDCLVKTHLTEDELCKTIRHTIERHRFSQESKRKVQRIYDFLWQVFNRIEDPVFVKDKNHQWRMCNKSFCDLVGVTEEEILNHSDLDFFSKEEVEVFWAKDNLVLETEQVNVNEETITTTKKGTRIISTKKAPFRDRRGESFIIGIISDVTKYRELIEEAERAREEAEKANKVKDNFLAVVSHELKNPLTAILCLTKYLQQEGLDQDLRKKALSQIERSARSQERLVNDLLYVSQIVHGGVLEIQSSLINIKELIEEVLETLKEKAAEKSIEIQSDLTKACIMGDPVRLEQIVTNLVCNAIKFTPENGKIKIRLSRTTKSKIKLEVKDTGVGIDPEFLPHVFDFFKRENGAGTKNVKGMGLGLGIVKNLVESHKGKITAHSAGKGKGATFKVTLPMIPCPDEKEDSETSSNDLKSKPASANQEK